MASEIKIYSKKFETYLIMPRGFDTYFYTLITSLTYIHVSFLYPSTESQIG